MPMVNDKELACQHCIQSIFCQHLSPLTGRQKLTTNILQSFVQIVHGPFRRPIPNRIYCPKFTIDWKKYFYYFWFNSFLSKKNKKEFLHQIRFFWAKQTAFVGKNKVQLIVKFSCLLAAVVTFPSTLEIFANHIFGTIFSTRVFSLAKLLNYHWSVDNGINLRPNYFLKKLMIPECFLVVCVLKKKFYWNWMVFGVRFVSKFSQINEWMNEWDFSSSIKT